MLDGLWFRHEVKERLYVIFYEADALVLHGFDLWKLNIIHPLIKECI